MASPVPPDGPPPVRAPDDNPASPMLVDDDVELVPPPAEEPKKRNAFDLMKASNLKAASQAKQLKKAKHAAAAPAAPAQASEHPPHEDVPPATPTATPAADGPTIDATPIATSVKKKPPSSEAQKSWIKTFPFINLATAVNLATNGAVLVGCSVCREIYGANSNKSYAAGNASVYSLNDLTKHSKCDEHKDAVDAKVKKDGGSGGIVAAAHAGARAHVEVLKGLLPTLLMGALWICTELLPGLKFASLLVALTKAGNTSINAKYNNRSYFTACVLTLSSVLLSRQLVQIRAAPCFTLMVDGSTDCSTEDHLLIYVVYCAELLEPTVEYLCTVKLSQAGADSIH
ncbi:hypothetical protein FOA52_013520 [Chlamydomonas sp. UWO 241]|nr:hypothetical protein FOA52_013520 [Chlamydomonas sp. UWO 241]